MGALDFYTSKILISNEPSSAFKGILIEYT
jgi:hypothetical protein